MKSSFALAMVAVYTNAVTINSQAPPQANVYEAVDTVIKRFDISADRALNFTELYELFNAIDPSSLKDILKVA
jgi:hypothetical protein